MPTPPHQYTNLSLLRKEYNTKLPLIRELRYKHAPEMLRRMQQLQNAICSVLELENEIAAAATAMAGKRFMRYFHLTYSPFPTIRHQMLIDGKAKGASFHDIYKATTQAKLSIAKIAEAPFAPRLPYEEVRCVSSFVYLFSSACDTTHR